jgi:hypothetical protein
VQKAADAILEGDRGEDHDPSWHSQIENTQTRPMTPPPSSVKQQGHASSVIDLTSDDEDLSRALVASLEPHNGTKYGPSQRPPHPDWAVVRSNVSIFLMR